MCTSSVSQMDDNVGNEEMVAAGLVDAHAYSLIDVKEINLDGGGT